MASKVNWDDILLEWSYRLPKGYPTMKDGKFTNKKELAILDEILAENNIRTPSLMQEKEEAAEEQQAQTVTLETLIDTLQKANLQQEDLLQIFRMVDAKQSGESVVQSLITLKNFTQQDSKLIFREAAETDSYKQLQQILSKPGKLIPLDTLIKASAGKEANLFTLITKLGVSRDFMQYMADLVPYTSVKMGRFEMFLRLFLEGGRSPKGSEAADVMVYDKKLEVKATKTGSGFRLRSQEKIGHGNDVAKYMTAVINQKFGGSNDIRQAEDPTQTAIPEDIMALRASRLENIYYVKKTESWAFVAFDRLLKEKKITLEEIKDIWANGLALVYKSTKPDVIRSKVVDPAIESDGSVGSDFYKRLAAFEFYLYAGGDKPEPHFNYFVAVSGTGGFFMIDPKEDFDKLVNIFSTKFKVGSPTTSQKSQAQDVLTSVELKEGDDSDNNEEDYL